MNVPLDSWVYGALDRLEGYGLIDSALSGTKPYSRLEVARLLGTAMKKWEEIGRQKKPSGFADKDLIPSLLERFKREFKRELIEVGALEGTKSPSFLKPVDEVILKYAFQSDNPVIRPQGSNPPTQTIYPIYNNDGIVYQKQNNFSAEIAGEGRLWDHFSLYYQPIFKNFENQNSHLELEKGYVIAEALNIALEAGRDSMGWGASYNGNLLMTNNARPFDLIKLANPLPFSLPLLGLFKFNIFLSRLDYGGPTQQSPSQIGRPTLHGLRLDFKPRPIFEIGISQIAIFGGEGRNDLSFGDYYKILYSNKNYSGKLSSNQQVSVDFSLRWPNFDKILPIFRSLKFYGEWGAEDTGFPPDRRAYSLGLFLNDLFLVGRADLRLEYAHTALKNVPLAWYTHEEYPPIYHERIFGHHMGSDAEHIFIRLTGYLSSKLLLGFDFNAETQGASNAVTTRSYEGGADLDYLIRHQMSIRGRYILEKFKDPNSIAGGDATHHFLLLELRQRF